MVPYTKPQQKRALATEERFLKALSQCLAVKSFNETTVDEIAEVAGLNRSAFLKRFGSKKGALFVLYENYCLLALGEISRVLSNQTSWTSIHDVCLETSMSLARIQSQHFGCNKAMYEHFFVELKTDNQTKEIFRATVDLMRRCQVHFLNPKLFTKTGAYAATQLLVTINHSYTLNAMPALPKDDAKRHGLIAECMCTALKL